MREDEHGLYIVVLRGFASGDRTLVPLGRACPWWRSSLAKAPIQLGKPLAEGAKPSRRSTSLESALCPPSPATASIVRASRRLVSSCISASISNVASLRRPRP